MKNSKRTKRVMAWAGIVVLLGLYLVTLILSFQGNPTAQAWFRGSFAATFLIPFLLYAMQLVYKLLKRNDEADTPSEKSEKKDGKR